MVAERALSSEECIALEHDLGHPRFWYSTMLHAIMHGIG
jgi:hypothetical protein